MSVLKRRIPDPANLFLALSLVFGVAYALLIPPFQSPDEPNHFLRAWQISEGAFWPDRRPDQRLGGELPLSPQALADSFAYLKNNYAARLDAALIRRLAALPPDYNKRGFLDFANTAIYAPFGYVPQALAIALLRPFGASVLATLYAARLFNLFVWCSLMFFALRRLSFKKNTIAFIALLPSSLVLAGSCNADVLVNALSFCVVVWAVDGKRWTVDGRRETVEGGRWTVDGRRWTVVGLLGIVCFQKLVLVPFALLLWCLPNTAAWNKWKYAGLFVAVAAAILGSMQAQHWFIPYNDYNTAFRDTQTLNEGVNPSAQIAYMLEHPAQFAGTMLESYARALPSTLAHVLGKFGWEKNYLPAGWLFALFLGLLLLLFSEENPLGRRERGLAGFVVLGYIVCFSVTMYALWCPVQAPVLSNLQGRYFAPVLPVAALMVGRWLPGRFLLGAQAAAWMVLVLSQVAMLFSIWARYYGG
ncbi:MAG: DUF2142 domain-containing protein [Bacteroidota bacterium]